MKFYLRNFFILLSVFTYALFRGTAKSKLVNPRRIIVVQNAKLGDMVCSTPVFRAIKKTFPGAHVVVMGNGLNKKLLEKNLDVDEYIIFERNFLKTLQAVRKKNIDFGIVLTPDMYGLALLFLGRVKSIVSPVIEGGSSPWMTKTYRALQCVVQTRLHTMGKYAPREYLRLLEPLGIIANDTKKYLAFSNDAMRSIDVFFNTHHIRKNNLVIGISPSAGNKIKIWGEEKFAQLADYIYEKYHAKIIIIGAANDKKEVDNMLIKLKSTTRVINALNIFNIDELKALISRMDIFISVDTGPIYIAETFGVSTIDIIGPVNEYEQPPIGKLHKIVYVTNRKRPELYVMNAKAYDAQEARRQIDNISVEMVIMAFEELVQWQYEKK